ncbi:hypothetical protein ACQFG6_005163 [Klebsiella michiganensis]|jgi:hypothetical protein|nr:MULTISPECIES: hypothetical protein [Bacteria]AUV95439.1 hypothetical protein C2U44_31015 [Klebsiella oxytoca]ELS5458868.1 hypothetical protein [Raoultella ornithinolytica]EME8857477.1 hypothetical protein [Klebsiella aerogenes]MBS6112372.1 hypothetical protein [Citrobacter freundii]DAM09701.1 MAG TPA: hypothetical protein [Caudoviricetes sp.]
MSNLNLKIEYVDGKLVALERNGVSFINTDVTGIFFSHTLKMTPQLNIEMGGLEVKEPSAQPAPQTQTEPVISSSEEPPKEGELLPSESQKQPRGRRRRNRQRNQ